MPKYQVINKSNAFDDVNNAEYASEEAADARAREVLKNAPNSVVQVVQVLKEYTAKVSVTATEPQTPSTPGEDSPAT